ncbi:recombinase [Sphaerospermopsis sp. LEGE 08334]|uniref:recombinase n=1 Tax=Sphaerospermopsis sp. LEGE 08334 TaxID=1828651 RepID=UPI001880CCAB|nr:recombinase [Sphaerospermopsis sp. LEGE 08334]MBE9058811.1 recombinase [Sphaerospermopsis sp. LEGE 08334]
MSKNLEVGGEGNFSNFEDLLKYYKVASSQLPKGISYKKQGKYLYLQFVFPGESSRLPHKPDYGFSYEGLIKAKENAFRIAEKLDTLSSVTEFNEWYDKEILGKNEVIDDRITYRQIFEKIEQKYWNGKNKNTKKNRTDTGLSEQASFDNVYGYVFKRFTDWDKQPTWDDIKSVLFSWEQGTKSFKDSYTVIKKIVSYCPNADKMVALLSEIDYKQTKFRENQSISLDQFLEWHDKALDDCLPHYLETRQSWLWVAAMCVVYGLRPSEIAAAKNLTKPYTKDGITIPAISNPDNKELLLVLGDMTYFGTTIKTGGRVCKSMCLDKKLLERLDIQKPKLPEYKPNKDSKPISIVQGFSNRFRDYMVDWKCPVTQSYAFRHLSNQLGEKYGIPQEIRARSLGHSVAVNESTYKKRSNFQTSVDLLTNHSKQPLSLDMAIQQLESVGFDLDDPSVNAILKVIYQLY